MEIMDNEKVKDALLDLKREIHDKAVYPKLDVVKPYITVKVFDAILNSVINKYEKETK